MLPPSRPARSPRRWFPVATAAALVSLGVFAPSSTAQRHAPQASSAPAAARASAPDVEAQFVSSINRLRASKGLSQLKVSTQVTGVARNWTDKMVANGKISHNPNLANEIKGDWTKAGENVGVGYDVDGLMQAFIDSSLHYKNLVDSDWNYLGVGVTLTDDGRMWTTHNFMALRESAPPPPPPSPAPAPAPAPAPPKASAPASPVTAPAASPRAVPATAPTPTTTTTTIPAPAPAMAPSQLALDRIGATLIPLRSLEGV